MPIEIDISGPQGNSLDIIGACRVVLRRCGRANLIPEYTEKAMSSNRENVLKVTKEYSQGIIIFKDSAYWDDGYEDLYDLEEDLENE